MAGLMDLLGAGGAGGLEGVGGLVDSGWGMYKDLQNLKMDRANSRETRKSQQLARLLALLEKGQGFGNELADQNRLYALRSGGA